MKDIAIGEEDIYSGFEIIASSGKMDNNFQLLTNFRKKISDENFASKVINDENLGNIEFELKKIERIVSTILSRIEREKRK